MMLGSFDRLYTTINIFSVDPNSGIRVIRRKEKNIILWLVRTKRMIASASTNYLIGACLVLQAPQISYYFIRLLRILCSPAVLDKCGNRY
jgi:hypothetical protein